MARYHQGSMSVTVVTTHPAIALITCSLVLRRRTCKTVKPRAVEHRDVRPTVRADMSTRRRIRTLTEVDATVALAGLCARHNYAAFPNFAAAAKRSGLPVIAAAAIAGGTLPFCGIFDTNPCKSACTLSLAFDPDNDCVKFTNSCDVAGVHCPLPERA